MKRLRQKGVCDESKCRYPTASKKEEAMDVSSQQPADEAFETAQPYRIWHYEPLNEKRSPAEKDELAKKDADEASKIKDEEGNALNDKLCKAISEGHPVQFGINYYHKAPDHQLKQIETRKGKKWPLVQLTCRHEKPPAKCGKHAALAIVYDEYSVICQTSYGAD
ncbi:uncharacterized protein A1O5_00043 [Cladophialophora psammophila CBS 110553]|uniref:Uncharacterized protein n=1 Tax=Cladophialophora psammophila CBS 110553 TaxID=1182543 RepID=W9X4V5_9EURO|nr:uncharacterized protein A1O5_00043 [Cladophialophora psammophila CBS 110553]EXJ75537.1 hypothetical protein A1O5_00043 [Cladophialophora psammophila CBS 110553]